MVGAPFLQRHLRPASYASLPKEFVAGCVEHHSFFGRNFEELLGVRVEDLMRIWSYDKMPGEVWGLGSGMKGPQKARGAV